MMNIGLILPAGPKNKDRRLFARACRSVGESIFGTCSVETCHIELLEGLNLVVCSIPFQNREELSSTAVRKRFKTRLDKIFEEERVWPVLEQREVRGIYHECGLNPGLKEDDTDPTDLRFPEALTEIAVNRFPEVLKLLHGIGDLSSREVVVTGNASHLEFAISRLIMKVRSLNILLPEGSQDPFEAEQAFAETGIPVHITTDPEVLDRSALWLRFPFDHEGFDALPEQYAGMIVDLGNMKIIDTRNKKIFAVSVEFSDKIKRKLGHNILGSMEEGVLESVIVTVCANAWDITCTEASLRLGMKLSFKS